MPDQHVTDHYKGMRGPKLTETEAPITNVPDDRMAGLEVAPEGFDIDGAAPNVGDVRNLRHPVDNDDATRPRPEPGLGDNRPRDRS